MNKPVNEARLTEFCNLYEGYLYLAVDKRPSDYPWWPQTAVSTVVGRMKEGFRNNSFNKESESIRKTCKALRIGWNYKSIREYLTSE